MEDSATARKLPDERRFTDLSDYARPLAARIALLLRDSGLTAPHVTLVWAIIGLAGAAFYAAGGYALAIAGTLALQIKNILDAVDGSLARVQRRPSRIGRFLDTDLDAVVAAAVYAALAVALARYRSAGYAVTLAGAALVLGLLQGTVFNYYYVLYRTRSGGDTTSHLREGLTAEDEARYLGRPAALALLRGLIAMYNGVYGWQDEVVRRLDGWAARPLTRVGRPDRARELRDDRRLLTAVSALGPGFQILVLNVLTIWGVGRLAVALELFLWVVAVGGTLYAAMIIVVLRVAARRSVAAES
jgi:hypothetical protein